MSFTVDPVNDPFELTGPAGKQGGTAATPVLVLGMGIIFWGR